MKKYYSLLLLLLILLINADFIFGIPAFARKYRMSCKTCHSPFPVLKTYGDEFAGNGFVLKDKDAPRYFVETGDANLSLLRELPVAVRLEGYLTYNTRNSDVPDFTAPYLLKLLSGGSIAKDVAYYFYFFFSERGEVAGIEDAFIMFNNLFGSELDFYIGQFQVSDPLFKRELRLTYDDYMIYKVNPGVSKINLTYDRGIILNYGFESGTNLTLEILNGTGIGGATPFRTFDTDKYKNIFANVSQDIGEHLRVGIEGYYGKEEIENVTDSTAGTNELWIAGVDATISVDPIEFNIQYMERRDDNPFARSVAETNDIKTRGGLAELIFRPEGDESEWYAVALYNKVKSDDPSVNWESVAFHLGFLLNRNIRLVGEFSYNIEHKYGRTGIGFISAF